MSQSERVPSYSVGTHAGEQFITCSLCGLRSYHPRDVEERYCGKCHVFHEDEAHAADVGVVLRGRELAREIGELAKAHPHLVEPLIRGVIEFVLVDFQARLLEGINGPELR